MTEVNGNYTYASKDFIWPIKWKTNISYNHNRNGYNLSGRNARMQMEMTEPEHWNLKEDLQ